MAEFNYSNYGSFKNYPGRTKFIISIARRIGIKNRYLRFLDSASKNLPVIEIGCGNGSFIVDLINAGFSDVKGVEPSGTYNYVADPNLISQDFAAPFLDKISASSLGAVVAMDVFEHIPYVDLRDLTKLIRSRLAEDGLLVFRVPNMSSPLALTNYYGDVSHTTPLNEYSIRQLAFEVDMDIVSINAEPFSYPNSLAATLGIVIWPFFYVFFRSINAAFGIRTKVLTPNLVCILKRKGISKL
jgi:SAM-dependent methyltransferase